ncbi:MAG: hypothetical protein K2Q22_02865, partial [Cytophagales bacterium]|nr:hypothetical protein [Cytophagales bacterium]
MRLKNVVVQHRLGKGLTYAGLNSAQSSQGVQLSNYNAVTNQVAFLVNRSIQRKDSVVIVYDVKADCNAIDDIGSSNNGERFDTLDVQAKQGTVDTLIRSQIRYFVRSAYLNISGIPPVKVEGNIGQQLTRTYSITQTSQYPNNRVAIQFKDSLPSGVIVTGVRLYKESDITNSKGEVIPISFKIIGSKATFNAFVQNLSQGERYVVEENIKIISCPMAINSQVNIRWGCDTLCFYKTGVTLSPQHGLLDLSQIRIDTSTIKPTNKYCIGTDPNLIQPTSYVYRITNSSPSPALKAKIELKNGGNLTVADRQTFDIRFNSTNLENRATVHVTQSPNPSCPNCDELSYMSIELDTMYATDEILVDVDYRIACGVGGADQWTISANWKGVCPNTYQSTSFSTNGIPGGNNFILSVLPPNVSTIPRNVPITREFYRHANGQFTLDASKMTTTYPNINNQTGIVRIHVTYGNGISFPGNLLDDAKFVVFASQGVTNTWSPYKAIADGTAGVNPNNGTPRGADFFFRLSDLPTNAWITYLASGRFYPTFQGYCPASQPSTGVNYQVFLRSDSLCTNGCEIPLAQDSSEIKVKCPGCKVPGPAITSIQLQRESYGYLDNDLDHLADIPFKKAGSDSLQTNPYMAAVGDTISLTIHGNLPDGDINGGYTYSQLSSSSALGPLKYIYLEAVGFPIQYKSIRALDTIKIEVKNNGSIVGLKTFKTSSILRQVGAGKFFYCIPVDSISYQNSPYVIQVGDEFYAKTLFHFQRNYYDYDYNDNLNTVIPKDINVTLAIGNQPLSFKDEATSVDRNLPLNAANKYLFYCEAFSQKFTFVPYDTIVSYEGYWDRNRMGGLDDACNRHISLRVYFTNKMFFPYEV